MRKTIRFLALLFGLCAPVGLYAQSAEGAMQISLAQALELATSNHPLSRQSAAGVARAEAQLRSARAAQNPTLSIAHGTGRDASGLDEDIILAQTIELGGKRAYRIRGAGADLSAAQYERIGTALDVRLSVQTAYYETLGAQDQYNLAAATLSVTKQFVEAAQTQFQAGDAPRSNVIRSQIELSRGQQTLTSAQTELDNRLAELCSLIGKPAGTKLTLTDKLSSTTTSYLLPDLENLALQNRPDLMAAQATHASLAAAVQSKRAESRPDLFIEGIRASVDPSVEGAVVRAGITFSPFDFGQKHADVAAAEAAVAQQDAAIAEAQRTALLEVETAYRDLQQARTTVESFEAGRLTNAKELLGMAQTGYEKGASSYLEVLDAQNVYRNEQADYARALADYNIALATLERAVGGKLP